MTLRQRVDRAQIVQIAVTLADEMGFEAVTLAAGAEKLGIRIPSLYHHVDGLPGLRSAVTLWAYQNLHTALQGAAVGKGGEGAGRAPPPAHPAFGHAAPRIYTAAPPAPIPTGLSGMRIPASIRRRCAPHRPISRNYRQPGRISSMSWRRFWRIIRLSRPR